MKIKKTHKHLSNNEKIESLEIDLKRLTEISKNETQGNINELKIIYSAIKQLTTDVNMIIDISNKNFIIDNYNFRKFVKEFDNIETKFKGIESRLEKKSGLIDTVVTNNPKPTEDKKNYFSKAKKLLIDYANKILVQKGNEYTPTGDRFGNFRPILNQQKTSIEKLLGYCEKHVQYMYMQKENPTCNDINELLEHFGDVFNYNILGMAMQNTDIPNSVVGYADRQTQENKIIEIINSFIENDDYPPRGYEELLFCTSLVNLATVTNELAIHLKRLDNLKTNFKEKTSCLNCEHFGRFDKKICQIDYNGLSCSYKAKNEK